MRSNTMKTNQHKIKVYFILASENLFHPKYFKDVLKRIDKNVYQVVGVTITKERYPKGFGDFVMKMIRLWGIVGFFIIGILSFLRSALNLIIHNNSLDVRTIAKLHSIPTTVVADVNSSDHLSYLRKKSIDIIVSSNGQIFKDDLLSLPRIGCINRHSGLLPNNAGVLPVFWAMFHNENIFGVTIHFMVKKIDEGAIIIQKKIVLKKKDSLFLNYIKAFSISAKLTLDALDIIKNKKIKDRRQKRKVTYYSFPKADDFKLFKKKYKAIVLKDILYYFTQFLK